MAQYKTWERVLNQHYGCKVLENWGAGVTPSKSTEKVSETVARAIVRDSAGLEPGARLSSEAMMLERYKVSRGSLREALRFLEVQGLIAIKPGPGGGPILIGPDVESMAKMQSLHFHLMGAKYSDLVAARVRLEPQIARMAATRQDRAALEQLRPYVREVDESNILIDADYLRAATGFHRVVCSLSGNSVLDMLASSLNQIVLTRLRGAVFSDDMRHGIVCDHIAIAEAILDGNGPLAELLMRDHMSEYISGVAEANQMAFDDVVDWR
jgi:GntR family transcriptional repressor for pyruvate dehydrogenase complex